MSTFFQDRMPNYLRWYCEELLTYFDKLVLLIFNPLVTSNIEFVESYNGRIIPHILPENSGLDFGAWYRSLHYLDDCTILGLVNDSCLPFRKLKPFFDWLESNNLNYAGFTNNMEREYHIQSYFLVIRGQNKEGKEAVETVKEFFKGKGVLPSREDVVQQYEIGLSRYMADNGFHIGAMYDCKLGKINWTMQRPVELIKQGFPFVKRKLGIKRFMPLMKEIANDSSDNINIDYIVENI